MNFKVALALGLFFGTALCCPDNKYECLDGKCIQTRFVCDSWVDCSKGEDDMGCLGCARDKFACHNNGFCIPWYKVCDGTDDCGDSTDERGCHNICWNIENYQITAQSNSWSNTIFSDDKPVSKSLNKEGKVRAARTNMYQKKNEAEKIANKLEKLRLLGRGKDEK
ncbi:suppressor of tumorigenicity 14 protein-like [Mytilus edulis]|uniref:suppressor of tumorigenicity 14 protein-like n=1 Tax=Mytilus edulis TaxID=6550 RepID=UPI0039F04B1B